jgi:hypothetical protein
MDLNDIVDNDFDSVIKSRVIVKRQEIKKNLDRMISDFEKQNKDSFVTERTPEIHRKMVCLCDSLNEKLTGKINEKKLILFLHNCQWFYSLESVEKITVMIFNYFEFVKEDS